MKLTTIKGKNTYVDNQELQGYVSGLYWYVDTNKQKTLVLWFNGMAMLMGMPSEGEAILKTLEQSFNAAKVAEDKVEDIPEGTMNITQDFFLKSIAVAAGHIKQVEL